MTQPGCVVCPVQSGDVVWGGADAEDAMTLTCERSLLYHLTHAGLVVGCVAGLGWTVGSRQCAGDELTDRFLREAPKAWRELRERYTPTETVLRHVNEGSRGNSNKYSLHYKHNGKCTVYIAESEDKDLTGETLKRSEVWGINERYAFYLRRKSAAAPWSLNQLAVFSQGGDATEIRRQIDRMIWLRNNELLFLDPETLPEMVEKPYFQLVAVRPVSEGDQDLVGIEFFYPHPPNEKAPYFNCRLVVDGATVVLDPKRYWCIRSFKCNSTDGDGSKYTSTQRNMIRDSNPPALSLAERVQRYTIATSKIATGMDKVEFSPAPPKSDFTLSAFGLPEPVGAVERRTPLYLWVALAGIVLVIGGVAIHRYALRTQ